MNKRRLLKLADLLDADAKNKNGIKFDMGGWGWVENESKPLSCGTHACAMGVAGLSGAFKRAGLGTKIIDKQVRFTWFGQNLNGFDAACSLFDIPYDDADTLFSPRGRNDEGVRGERAKAKEIRRFVKTGELIAGYIGD